MLDTRAVKIMTKWQKRSKGRPKNVDVEEDLRSIGKYTHWRRESKDCDKRRNIVEGATSHKGL